jgi:hypothetical protein
MDVQGNPVTIQAPVALLNQLESLNNRSVLSTDLRNRVESLNQTTSGTFFFDALRLLQQLQLMGLLFPETILTATGVGDSNLNTGQRSTLGLVVRSLVGQIKEVILNSPVRWLLTWNYGQVEDFGAFSEPETQEIDPIALFNALNGAVQSGYFSAADLSVINRGRELVGLPLAAEPGLQTMGRLLGNLDYWKNGAGSGAGN